MKTRKQINPFPFFVYFWTVGMLALVGLCDSVYLSVSHYRVYTDIGYKSFCAVSRAINCDTVSQSVYSILLGVPVPVWGIIGYTFLLLLIPFAWFKGADKKRMWTLLFLIALAFSLSSIILALIAIFHIRSYCMMCIVSYAINFLLLFYTWLIRRRFGSEEIIEGVRRDVRFLRHKRKPSLVLLLPFFVGLISIMIFFPNYRNSTPPALGANIPTGMTRDGHPWIGADNPKLVLEEFTDYRCFQCKKMHSFLRQLIAEYPKKIRLVHRHFPMDHEFNPMLKEAFHVGTGKLALLANYAATQDKFWEMNDLLFEIARQSDEIDIKALAEKTGLDPRKLALSIYDRNIRLKLLGDIRDGLELGVTGTPAFLIDHQVYVGQVPPAILNRVLD